MTERAKRRLYALIAIAIAGGALTFIAAGNLGENLVYYWTPTELVAKGEAAKGATVRLGGLVSPGSVSWDPAAQFLTFQITDGDTTVRVESQGGRPQMFREGIGVVIEGHLGANGVFLCESIFVKHSNEYRAPEDGERPEDIYRTLVVEDS